jgi:hypothetical protein
MAAGAGLFDSGVFVPVQSASHPFERFSHQNAMLVETQIETPSPTRHHLRTPSQPSPAPIKEPPNPPENPDVPVREPDPDDLAQI